MCEYLFGIGELTTGTRVNFQRLYDLPEQWCCRPSVLAAPTPDQDTAARRLIMNSAGALGVATEPELRDYYRLGPDVTGKAVAELVSDGALEPVAVHGWAKPGYRLPDARMVPARSPRGPC